jgi:tryptophan-rich sensory protein
MAKQIKFLMLFLFINFGGLALGSWLMNNGPMTDWYLNLNKAPWTPPGWFFGVAWTTIMICFSIYLVYLFTEHNSRGTRALYIFQVLLNVSWNYIFFNQQEIILALLVISILSLVILYYFLSYRLDKMKRMRLLLLPYLIWLTIATSLNAYILIYN